MINKFSPGLFTAFILSLIVVGLPYWSTSYSELSLPSSLFTPALLAILLSAVILKIYTDNTFQKILHTMAFVLPAVVAARIIVDAFFDSTSHNLFPLELIIALITGYAIVIPAVLLGSLLRKFLRKSSD